jgi:hypothetical protein
MKHKWHIVLAFVGVFSYSLFLFWVSGIDLNVRGDDQAMAMAFSTTFGLFASIFISLLEGNNEVNNG